jgi:hypothetical protein
MNDLKKKRFAAPRKYIVFLLQRLGAKDRKIIAVFTEKQIALVNRPTLRRNAGLLKTELSVQIVEISP